MDTDPTQIELYPYMRLCRIRGEELLLITTSHVEVKGKYYSVTGNLE